MNTLCALIALLFSSLCVFAQQALPNVTLYGTFDAAGTTSAKPFPIGTSLPATCTVGQLYWKSDASPGANIYGCPSTNTWVVMSGAAAGVATVSGPGFACDGTSGTGNCTFNPPSSFMLQGSDNSPTGRWDARGASSTFPHKTTSGAAPSVPCTAGQTLFRNDISPGKLYLCPTDAVGTSTSNWAEIPQGITSSVKNQILTSKISGISGPQATGSGGATPVIALPLNGPMPGSAPNYATTNNLSILSVPVVNSATTFKNPCVTVFGTQPGDGALTLDLMKDAAGNNTFSTTGVSITIPAGYGASSTKNVICNTASSSAISTGDFMLWRGTNASASSSIFISSIAVETDR